VENDCGLPGHPEVFAIGNIACAVDPDGKEAPGVAPAAIQMAKHVAAILKEKLDGKSEPNAPPRIQVQRQRQSGNHRKKLRRGGTGKTKILRLSSLVSLVGHSPRTTDGHAQPLTGFVAMVLCLYTK
jgi:NADH dehydrogenase FAD-containing subunit